MSGGALDYFYFRFEDVIEQIQERYPDSAIHSDFIKHLRKVQLALHDVEWVMSGDYKQGDDVKAIKKCLKSAK